MPQERRASQHSLPVPQTDLYSTAHFSWERQGVSLRDTPASSLAGVSTDLSPAMSRKSSGATASNVVRFLGDAKRSLGDAKSSLG
jgi:hypothetical protein